MSGITVTQETIGPDEAVKYLGLNTHNRHIRPELIETIRRDIVSDNYQLNGETIKFSVTDKLLDGQHRLLAVLEAGKPIVTLVVRGLPDEVQVTVDSGSRRKFGDYLHLDGEIHSATLAASTRVTWFLTTYGVPRRFATAPSVSELYAFLQANPGLRETSVLGVQANRSSLKITGSSAASLAYLMGQLDETLMREFWRQLLENDAPAEGAIWALRESLTKDLSKPHRMDVFHRMALIIKAWNYWLEGRTMTYIVWRPMAEDFPKLRAPEKGAE